MDLRGNREIHQRTPQTQLAGPRPRVWVSTSWVRPGRWISQSPENVLTAIRERATLPHQQTRRPAGKSNSWWTGTQVFSLRVFHLKGTCLFSFWFCFFFVILFFGSRQVVLKHLEGCQTHLHQGPFSLVAAFKGPNVVSGLCTCNYSLTVKWELSTATR